uniref:Phosphatidylinositol-4-phosphate 5-kinase n=1 Tax=viral metagenome TaxID=1070528 RepID=A0A6C0KG05_9ZZZZ
MTNKSKKYRNNKLKRNFSKKRQIGGGNYDGEWKDGKKHGQGKMTYNNRDIYEGEWKDDKRHGHGKYSFIDGEVYEGEWKNGQRDGQGKMAYKNGNLYEGEWKDGKREGQGKIIYSIGQEYLYEGNWKDNMKNGPGKIIERDDKVFEGEWKDDKPYDKKEIQKTTTKELTISNTNYKKCLEQSIYDFIELTYVNVEDFMNEDKDNLVFKFGDFFYGVNKKNITSIYKNDKEKVYCCFKIDDTRIVPRRANLDLANIYFYLNKLGIPAGIVKREYIQKILDDETNKLYEIIETTQKCEAITTKGVLGPTTIQSGTHHCQSGTNNTIYEIQIIKEETTGGKKYKKSSRKNKTVNTPKKKNL